MLTVRIFSNDEYLHSMEPRMIAPNALPMLRDVDISNAVSISLLFYWRPSPPPPPPPMLSHFLY